MWPEIALLVASTLLKNEANDDAARRRESLRRSMETYQRAKAADTQRATEDLLTKQTPKAREAEFAGVTADREQSLRDTVGAAQAFDAPPVAGKASADYRATDEAMANSVAERTRRAIQQLATIGAPGEVQQRFGMRFGRSAGTVDANNRASANVGTAYTGDIDRVQPDPFLTMLADVGQKAGGAMLGQTLSADPNTIAWMGEGEPTALDITDAQMAGKTFRKPTVSENLRNGFSLWERR